MAGFVGIRSLSNIDYYWLEADLHGGGLQWRDRLSSLRRSQQ
jgi:hypothetical protein